MTNALSFLDELDDSEESELELVAVKAFELYGIEIRAIHCLHTGKEIGRVFDSELEEAIYEEGDKDLESLADAMMVRTIASMRPSPALNKPDIGTIREMAVRRPTDALAYLVNRLYGTKQLLVNRGEEWFQPLLSRVQTYYKLYDMGTRVDQAAYIHWLLELDSKLNLHEITPPLFEKDRLGKWLVTKTGVPLIEVIREDGILAAFESWVFEKLHEWDKQDSQALAQLRWARGNRMAAPAYVRSYLDNPEIANRKHAEEIARKQRAKSAKPAKPVSAKTQLQNARLKTFLDLMDTVIESKPPVAPVTPKPSKILLGGMLFAKKES